MDQTKKYRNLRKFWAAAGWVFVALFVLSMLGLIVCIVMLGLGYGDPVLLGELSGGALFGFALFGLFTYLAVKESAKCGDMELDALEREDGEDSFFIGEGTLATFEKERLRIHGAAGKQEIAVPYREMRFFSVCSRKKPAEKGSWSVVLEMPSRYFQRDKSKEAPPVLVQADGKERLYRCLEAHGLKLLGEARKEPQKKRFERLYKTDLPDRAKRKRALILWIAGGVLIAAGVGLMFWRTEVGAIVGAVGLYAFGRAAVSFVRAKKTFSFYAEGVLYREPGGADDVFLKWEEIESVSRFEQEGKEYLRLRCPYGAYDFPMFEGAYDRIAAQFPDKCGN